MFIFPTFVSRPKTVGPSLTYTQLAHSEHNDGSDDEDEEEEGSHHVEKAIFETIGLISWETLTNLGQTLNQVFFVSLQFFWDRT